MDTPVSIDTPHPRHWKSPFFCCHNLPSLPQPEIGRVLVTGASGYIGGRLMPELLARGYRVRVAVRAASREYAERWPGAEIFVADAMDPKAMNRALVGVSVAYYLIHSLLLGPKDFEASDILAARNFRRAAEAAGVKRIIYLGGLGDTRKDLSDHLRSRTEVAKTLQNGPIPVTVLRAAVIIGSGSASYEIIEHLVKNCPLIIMPGWARKNCQPIAIRDVMKYLVGVIETPETEGKVFDIGGLDILTYKKMMQVLAELLSKKRYFLFSPISPIGLFAYITSLVTPVPTPIVRCLIEGLNNDVVCQDKSIRDYLPFATISYRRALVRAMSYAEQDRIHTRWSDAYPPAHELALKFHELHANPRYSATYSLITEKHPTDLFHSICRIGGKEGWFHNNWMWRIRGAMDRLVMGVGTSRGRKSRSELMINDVLDFWRVEDLKPARRLLLRAEMKLPGRAWLEFSLKVDGKRTRLTVRPYYDTHSLWGKIYWFSLVPFHRFIFTDLIKQIEAHSRAPRPTRDDLSAADASGAQWPLEKDRRKPHSEIHPSAPRR